VRIAHTSATPVLTVRYVMPAGVAGTFAWPHPFWPQQAIVPEAGKDGVVSLIRVVIGPYEAGPYAEGSYDIAVPVDAGVLGAIKPEYRGSFAGGR